VLKSESCAGGTTKKPKKYLMCGSITGEIRKPLVITRDSKIHDLLRI